MTIMRALLAIPWLVLYVFAADGGAPLNSNRIDAVSFKPPFNAHDLVGERVVGEKGIGKGFSPDGDTHIAQNFVRLTPDRQSKRGALWSNAVIGERDFAVVMEFRISGRDRRLFGDGLALWIAQSEQHVSDDWGYMDDDYGPWDNWGVWHNFLPGELHGFSPDFYGVGVIIDTYMNADTHYFHKDASIVSNNRTMSNTTEIIANAKGCHVQARWFEGRSDFKAGSASSRIKVVLSNNVLTLSVDEKNKGEWRNCAEVNLDHLKPDWLETAHIGVTSTTGDLSDNHDVIRIEAYRTEASLEEAERIRREQPRPADSLIPDIALEDMTPEERIARLETYLSVVLVKLEMVEHHLEHQLIELSGFATDGQKRLQKQEDDLKLIVSGIDSKVKDLEKALSSQVEAGLTVANKTAAGWRGPLFLFAVIMFAVSSVGIKAWLKLRKTHLL